MKMNTVSTAVLGAAALTQGAQAFAPAPTFLANKGLVIQTPPGGRLASFDTSMKLAPQQDNLFGERDKTGETQEQRENQLKNVGQGDSCLVEKVVRPTQAHLEKVLADSVISMIRGGETGGTRAFILHALNALALGATVEQLNSCFGELPRELSNTGVNSTSVDKAAGLN